MKEKCITAAIILAISAYILGMLGLQQETDYHPVHTYSEMEALAEQYHEAQQIKAQETAKYK